MKINNTALNSIFRLTLLFSALYFPQSLWAGDITPFNGLWIIDEENNGKPGRGFQMDVQNDVLVMSFYGYDESRNSSWWLAAGAFSPNSNQLVMDLEEYTGGMNFGSSPQDANYLGAAGSVTISFSKPDKGTICLPGEACKSISPYDFGYANSSSELQGLWFGNLVLLDSGYMTSIFLQLDEVLSSPNPNVIDKITGIALVTDNGFQQLYDLVCEKLMDDSEFDYFCKIKDVDFGSSVYEISLKSQKNLLVGNIYDELGVEVTTTVMAFRIQNNSGRTVYPN